MRIFHRTQRNFGALNGRRLPPDGIRSKASGRHCSVSGADEVIDYRENPAWWEKARALTGGMGVDRVTDATGGRAVWRVMGGRPAP